MSVLIIQSPVQSTQTLCPSYYTLLLLYLYTLCLRHDRHTSLHGRIQGAREVLRAAADMSNDSTGSIALIIDSSDVVADFFISLGNYQINKTQTISMTLLPKYKEMTSAGSILPVPTAVPHLPPLKPSHFRSLSQSVKSVGLQTAVTNFVRVDLGLGTMEVFGTEVRMTETGITGPKIVHVNDSMRIEHKLIVKGRGDDLRQDAVIEQLFCLLNKVSHRKIESHPG